MDSPHFVPELYWQGHGKNTWRLDQEHPLDGSCVHDGRQRLCDFLHAWAKLMNGSRRTVPLPPGWNRIRQLVLMRDRYRCRWGELPGEFERDGIGAGQCSVRATDADHTGAAWDHDPDKLRAMCDAHHKTRTALQANVARGEAGSEMRNPRKRPGRPHPGAR